MLIRLCNLWIAPVALRIAPSFQDENIALDRLWSSQDVCANMLFCLYDRRIKTYSDEIDKLSLGN